MPRSLSLAAAEATSWRCRSWERPHQSPDEPLRASHLQASNLIVTFVVTEEWLGFIRSEPKPDNVHFAAIPNVIPSRRSVPGGQQEADPDDFHVADVASVFTVFHHFPLLLEKNHFPLDLSQRGDAVVDYIRASHQLVRMISSPSLTGRGDRPLRTEFSFPVYNVGPLIPIQRSLSSTEDVLITSGGWIPSRRASVLYISLGSFLSVSMEQMREVVAGVHESGVRFLCVSRGNDIWTQDGDRGVVVPWCDQLRGYGSTCLPLGPSASPRISIPTSSFSADYVVVPDDHSRIPSLSVKVTSPYGNNLHHEENVTHGQFAFTTKEGGNYLACFWVDGNNQGGGDVSVNIDWKTGIAAKDWDSVARKEKIEGVELELRKLEGHVETIRENLSISKPGKHVTNTVQFSHHGSTLTSGFCFQNGAEQEAEMRMVSERTNAVLPGSVSCP
ncbi:hypothetical protein MLD38_026664 [Melastoma candidum]|uniref:Uncharacterized protein n=1 Tax=Melastoma candidum TaxID=119954 RepID=A0ACB9P081_9MYRT|nr:hypothetical protein MLD38_026664 [Melastoma candidum]